MRTRTLQLFGLTAMAAVALHGQSPALPGSQPPTTGAVYYSTTGKPDCTSLDGESPVAIMSGTTVAGYSCYVSGTFVWMAAGAGWVTSLSVAAPASGAIGVDYSFYDALGNSLSVDTTPYRSSTITSGSDYNFALSANQPADINLHGATSAAPNYSSQVGGSIYAVFYCPDADTCARIAPQLFYVALPPTPSVTTAPIAWDTALWTQWSTQGFDDGDANRVSLAIYNEDTTAATYTVSIYDGTGALAGTGTTPPVPPLQSLGNGALGEGGTYGALLSDLISTPLPQGVFKIHIDGGSLYSAVEVLQFSRPSVSNLQLSYDSSPIGGPTAASVQRAAVRAAHVASRPKHLFSHLVK